MEVEHTYGQLRIAFLRKTNHAGILTTHLSEFDFADVTEDISQGLPCAGWRQLKWVRYFI